MKILSRVAQGVWYERIDGEIVIHEDDSDRVITAPMDIALKVLLFKTPIMTEIGKVIDHKEQKCPVCGKQFVAAHPQIKTCSEECQSVRKDEQRREYRKKPKKPKRKSQLVAAENEARAKGMSYGQYKALETIEKYGRVKV